MITYIVGLAGSGKTTHASHLVYKAHRKGLNIYSNVPIFNARVFDPLEDLMTYSVSDGIIIIDEAAIDFNSRKYKTLSDNVNEFVRKHRHARTNIYVYSQNFMGADKLFRDNAEFVMLLRKSRIPKHAFVRVYKHDIVPPDKDNPEFRDIYRLDILSTRLMRYGGKYTKMFNSFEMPPLPNKEWILWQDTNQFSPTPRYKRCNRLAERWANKIPRRGGKLTLKRKSKERGAISTIGGELRKILPIAGMRERLTQGIKAIAQKTRQAVINVIAKISGKTKKQTTEKHEKTETKEKASPHLLSKGASASPPTL